MRFLVPLTFVFLALSFGPYSQPQDPQAPAAATPVPPEPVPDAAGVYKSGKGVTAPTLIYSVSPDFSEQARKARLSGACTVSVVVDKDGKVQDAQISRSAAEGQPAKLRSAEQSLDRKAIEAVRQYRFKPALLHGKPVPVALTIEVNFQAQ